MVMDELNNKIKKRQDYYFKGREFEKIGNFQNAIESYLEYSKHLDIEDQHIPKLWISKLFKKLGDKEHELLYHLDYIKGCTKPTQVILYNELGKEFKVNSDIENSRKYISLAKTLRKEIDLENQRLSQS